MSRDIKELSIDSIAAGTYRLRRFIPDDSELADSIKASGLLEPIGVVQGKADHYELIYGERRLLACQKLSWKKIAAQVFTDPQEALVAAVTENIQRKDINPLEEALAYRRLLNTGMTQQELVKSIGKSQSYIAQKLRLEKLPMGAISMMMVGHFKEGHMRQLLRIEKIVKETIGNKPKPHRKWFYDIIFEAEGPGGVHDMVTYYQDRIAWGWVGNRITVAKLKRVIDRLERQLNGEDINIWDAELSLVLWDKSLLEEEESEVEAI